MADHPGGDNGNSLTGERGDHSASGRSQMRPLGIPAGSVRALLALVLLLTTCVMALLTKTVPDRLWSLTEMAVSLYFVGRVAHGKGGSA
jgi:hypothetical protein